MAKVIKKKGKLKMQSGGVASKVKKVAKLADDAFDVATRRLPKEILKRTDDRLQRTFPGKTGKGSLYDKVKPYVAGMIAGFPGIELAIEAKKKRKNAAKAKSTMRKGGTVKAKAKTKSKK